MHGTIVQKRSLQADSLFSPGDCVLSDVSLSDALDRRDLNLADRREFNLNEKHFNANDDKQVTDMNLLLLLLLLLLLNLEMIKILFAAR